MKGLNLTKNKCCIASLIIPGLGQFLQRRILAGILYFTIGLLLWTLDYSIVLVVHIISAISAYRYGRTVVNQQAVVIGSQEIVEEGYESEIPFQLQKSESLKCLVPNTNLCEYKTHRSRTGTSQGLSIRVAKGLWYRPGASQSRYHNEEVLEHTDTGLFGITDKHYYFAGPARQFRIPRNKVVALSIEDDGLVITQDSTTAKPQYFVFGTLDQDQIRILSG